MTFLNPGVLWLLPLAALPWLALLVRRRAGRSLPWGASLFLADSARAATRWLGVRRFAGALCGCLALCGLILGAARPLVEAGADWRLTSPPEVVLICLDRSPALAATAPGGRSLRQVLLSAIQRRALALAEGTRFLMVDAVRGTEATPADPAHMPQHPAAASLDVATDIPRLLTLALDRIAAEAPGTAEVWLGTGLRTASWQPDQPAWQALRQRLDRAAGRVRLRWFRAPDPAIGNLSLRLAEAGRDDLSGAPQVRIAVSGQARGATTVSVRFGDEARSFVIPAWSGIGLVQTIPLDPVDSQRVGEIRLPDDANPADNTIYVALPARTPRLTLVACAEEDTARLVAAAAAPEADDALLSARRVALEDLAPAVLASASLVVLDRLPEGPAERALEAFVQAGGAVLVFPAAETESRAWLGLTRGGPLVLEPPLGAAPADPREELVAGLPLEHVQVRRLCGLRGGGVLAATADGRPLLVHAAAGRGSVVWCAAALAPDASNLADGVVLLPLVQRLAANGARRLSGIEIRDCALLPSALVSSCLLPSEPDGDRAAGLKSGIVRCRFPGEDGTRTVVLQRPLLCDAVAELPASAVAALVGPALQPADTAGDAVWEAAGALHLLAVLALGAALVTCGYGRRRP